jgi:hypothetical protein
MEIILTTPHAHCPKGSKIRLCDLAASISGDIFNECCTKKGINTIYLKGNEYRYNWDLNRKESRNTNFRKELTKLLSGKEKPKLLLDIHSFPNERIEEAGDINFFSKNETAPDIVLLRGPSDIKFCNGKRKSICNEIFTCLQNIKDIKIKVIDGITVNDILNETHENEIPGILIEINEKFNNDHKNLFPIVECIINKVKEIL